MIAENRVGTHLRRRNNNLAGYAIVCFISGGPLIQMPLLMTPFMLMTPGANIGVFLMMLSFGVIVIMAGIILPNLLVQQRHLDRESHWTINGSLLPHLLGEAAHHDC
ncbi:MAG: hypothetical protein DRP09_04385 [Candidatus Thorarchaeota archaeon]|nr:MAG: hypothetical protein DRP09_04385 [Candidatus Thorarchaeota archaeon]